MSLMAAMDDALAVVEEHRHEATGVDLDSILGILRLSHRDVEEVLTARWEAAPEGTDKLSFVAGFTEALLALSFYERRRRATTVPQPGPRQA